MIGIAASPTLAEMVKFAPWFNLSHHDLVYGPMNTYGP